MPAVGVLLLAFAALFIYSGLSSLYPTKLMRAILRDPAHAAEIIEGGRTAVTKSSRVSTGGSFGTADAPTTPVDPGLSADTPLAYQSYAESLMGSHLWSVDQMGPLVKLWQQESSWNPLARNAQSGAYGIPQALPASKMATAGGDYLTNYKTQIKWGLSYISSTYGTPAAAWAHEQSKGWY